jgi:hypothetical protein
MARRTEEALRRSRIAVKAARTRARNKEFKRRSDAAKKGWITRRRNAKKEHELYRSTISVSYPKARKYQSFIGQRWQKNPFTNKQRRLFKKHFVQAFKKIIAGGKPLSRNWEKLPISVEDNRKVPSFPGKFPLEEYRNEV